MAKGRLSDPHRFSLVREDVIGIRVGRSSGAFIRNAVRPLHEARWQGYYLAFPHV